MDDAEADVLAYMSFPAQHRAKIHSTNPIERLNGEIKRRSDVVGIFASPLAARKFFESEEYRATEARQREAIESVGVFLVTSIYTFIRDGEITTAGLRGSRSAQLIEEIGAANQTQADVTRRFTAGPLVADIA